MKYITIINHHEFEIEVDAHGNVMVNGEPRHADFLALGESLYSLITDGRSLQVVIDEDLHGYTVRVEGRMYEGQVLDERAMLMAQRRGGLGGGSGELHSPMPGLIIGLPVEEGQMVAKGQTLVVLESMKMQNELKAPVDGQVQAIAVEKGQTVEKGTLLVVIVPPEA